MAAVGGAGAGVASQGVSDVLSGRPSSAKDYIGAAVGGAADGLVTLRYGPVRGGAIGGVLTTALQDELSGRVRSLDDVIGNGEISAALGGLGGAAATGGARKLASRTKGKIGEFLSAAKTIARGDGIPFNMGRRLDLSSGRHTFTDLQFSTRKPGKDIGVGEAKLGPTAELSPRQLEAQAQPNIDYVVDGWRFTDVGNAAGAALSLFGTQFENGEQFPWMR